MENLEFIDVNYESLANLMKEFESEIKEMQTMLEDVEDETKDIPSIWDGDDSEPVVASFTEFKKYFEEINTKNKKYLDFLENVIQTYKKSDTDTSQNIDESAGSFDANLR